jgi:hypothetical protein
MEVEMDLDVIQEYSLVQGQIIWNLHSLVQGHPVLLLEQTGPPPPPWDKLDEGASDPLQMLQTC